MTINNEECKRIPDYSRYVISERGRIYRTHPINKIERYILQQNPDNLYFRESKSKLYINEKGVARYQVGLVRDDGTFVCANTEKLICFAFGLWPKNYKILKIIYKDGNPENICIENIGFVARKPSNSKLTKDDVVQIKQLIKGGHPLKHISKVYGVSEMQISRIKTGENWRRGGRVTPLPTTPFKVEDGRMRRFLASFAQTEIQKTIRRPFTLKRNSDPTNNTIIGVVNGYRFSKTHTNVSRARVLVFKLNKYFYSDEIAVKMDKQISVSILKTTAVLLNN